jgi:signal transduction histidine kinase
VRHNVFLAFKEALHNVVKHAGATEVVIRLTTAAEGFALRVCDNGRGFDPGSVPARPGRGNGLKNMRQRLEQSGGQCRIHSTPTGTEVEFFVAGHLPFHPH